MLDALKFVKGSVGKENKLTPALNHFRIERGRIVGLNDTFALSSPIATDIEATPKGVDFAKAVERCKNQTVSLFMEDERLVIKSGRLTVRVDCTTEPFPMLQPEGHTFPMAPNFVESCKRLLPFLTKDNTRAWARGALLNNMSMTATDNVSLIQAYLGPEYVPPLAAVIPEPTLKELIRIGEAPTHASVSVRSITFYYPGDRWLCSLVLPNDWPDINRFFADQQELQPITEDFWNAIDSIYSFTDDRETILFDDDCMRTHVDKKAGATIEGDFPAKRGAICGKSLLRLKPIASHLAFDAYPRPMLFVGEGIRGVITGMIRNDA